MANAKHLEILKQGVKKWNEWRRNNLGRRLDLGSADLSGTDFSSADLAGADLYGADLSDADLCDANLLGANLRNANLRGTNLRSANLRGANLRDANLRQASLIRANLRNTDLRNTDLRDADLRDADFYGANLYGTNLSRADLCRAIFTEVAFAYTLITDVDLRQSIGLESAIHLAPSSIGIDTLYKSLGKIPEAFLRGCGVSNNFIMQSSALTEAEEGIQFYSCFISYSGLDDEFARRLHARLQQDHVRVWFSPHDIQGGRKLHEQIDEAIKVHDKLLILLSPNSLKSEWVMTELRKARKAERKTGQRKLFPVGLVDYETLREWECFDADGGQDLAVEVREYFIPDFTQWKDHDTFETAYARLLKDLRAATPATSP